MENEVRKFYNKYGIREWNRLEENTYSKINFLLHMHFIERHLHKGMKILDAGCGAGRYSIEFAKRGCNVTLVDLGGSPCFSCGNNQSIEELCKNEKAFNTIMQIELETYTKSSMVDNGEFLFAKGIKNN